MTKNLLEQFTDLIHTNEIYNSETGILKNKLIEDGFKNDPSLIQLLLSSPSLKTHFFTELDGGILIFNSLKFQQFLSLKDFLPDSYTSFKNKIGLTDDNGDYLSQNKNVVLNFPFKDCVLEGGQTKDDAKRKEIFWNEILAPDEIDALLEPKILTNAKKYTIEGAEQVTEFNRNSDGVITDNLIIKGNNLIVLHSLKKEFKGKVKLIYIDPPYNTGNDSFGYNDKFNHSTWLVFMKNRLEVARELLRDDGVIFVQCDDNEQAYLKVLMDEVFGRENFISNIIDIVKPEGRRYGYIAQAHEYLIVFGKRTAATEMFEMTSLEKKLPYKDKIGNFDIVGLRNRAVQYFNSKNRPNLYYPFYIDETSVNENGFMKISTQPIEGYTKVMPSEVDGVKSVWRWGKEKAENQSDQLLARLGSNGNLSIFKKDYSPTTMPTSFWQDKELITQKGTQQLDTLFNKKIFAFPKPESLIQRIIEISTQAGDIVLDYHLGSGTTAAVAHKMRRQYIGVEQMDYIETISAERMKKVIGVEVITQSPLGIEETKIGNFDTGGISKAVNWQGGGEFVYLELKQHNQDFVERIQKATNQAEIKSIWRDIQKTGFLSYKVDPKVIDKNITAFESLNLEDGQRFLMEVLDKNMLYVNYSDIDNEDYPVSNEEKAINRSFYNVKK